MTHPLPDTSPGANLPGNSQVEVADWFAAQLRAALSNPLLYIPKTFETWMNDRVAVSGLDIPIGQIVGYGKVTGIRGEIASDGTTAAGTGFTSSQTSTGVYVVTYDNEFAAQPIVVANATTSSLASMTVSSTGTASATIEAFDATGTHRNASFTFWAMPVDTT